MKTVATKASGAKKSAKSPSGRKARAAQTAAPNTAAAAPDLLYPVEKASTARLIEALVGKGDHGENTLAEHALEQLALDLQNLMLVVQDDQLDRDEDISQTLYVLSTRAAAAAELSRRHARGGKVAS